MSVKILGTDIPVANGYSSYLRFISSLFSESTLRESGPDFPAGAQIYTLGLVGVAPSLETFGDLVSSLSEVKTISQKLQSGLMDDIVSNYQKISDLISQNSSAELDGILYPAPSSLVSFVNKDTLRVGTFNYIYKNQKSIFNQIDLPVSKLDDNGYRIIALGKTQYTIRPATSYVVYFDLNSKEVGIELLEKSSETENRIDILATVADRVLVESAVIDVFLQKLFQMKKSKKIPLAVLTRQCTKRQLDFLSKKDITGNQNDSVINLTRYCSAKVQVSDNPEASGLVSKSQILLDAASSEKSQTPSNWGKIALSTLPPVNAAIAYLYRIKGSTEKIPELKGLAKFINDAIETIISYIDLLSEFIRQLDLLLAAIGKINSSIGSLNSLNLYILFVPVEASAVNSTEDLKRIYLNASGLPTSDNLYFASIVTVVGVSTPDSVTEKLKLDYGKRPEDSLDSYLVQQSKRIVRDNPDNSDKLASLFSLLRKAGILK